jgi:hypothetical protein
VRVALFITCFNDTLFPGISILAMAVSYVGEPGDEAVGKVAPKRAEA